MSDGDLTLGLAVAMLGAAACFFGHRIFTGVLAAIGFVAGGLAVSAAFTALTRSNEWAVVAFLIGGLAAGAAAIALRKLGAFLLGSLLGVVVVFVILRLDPEPFMVLGVAVVLGIAALALERFVIIASTSALGALVIVAGAGFVATEGAVDPLGLGRAGFGLADLLRSLSFASPAFVAAWFVVGVGGGIFQYRSYRDESGAGTREASTTPDVVATPRSSAEPSRLPRQSEPASAPRPSAPIRSDRTSGAEAPSAHRSRPEAPAPAGPLPLVVVHDEAEVPDEDEAMERLAARLEASRAAFRRGLDALREETFALTRAEGSLLASWTAPPWDERDATPVAADVAERGVRLGDLHLLAGGDGEDMWTVPAVVAPARYGAVLVETDPVEAARVRAAIVGWCLRVIAAMGPGRVGVAWFEDGPAEGVPAAWRVPAGTSLAAWFERRITQGAGAEPTGTRWVVVGVGPVADALPDAAAWVDDQVAAGLEAGVTLWLAASQRMAVVSEQVLCLTMVRGNPGRFQVPSDALGRHEVRLQEAAPPDLLERYAAWALPVDGEATLDTEAQPDAGARAHEVARPSTDAVDHVAPPISVAERVRALLTEPERAMPRLGLGYDEDRRPVELTLDRPLHLRGGTAEGAAAMLAGYLFEIACQTHADRWAFAVLDFSDDPAVADRFDDILDLTPHLVEYTEGVSAHIKLEDTLSRLEQSDPDLPSLALFVLANPSRPVPDGLRRVVRGPAAARVHPVVWQAAAGPSVSSDQPGDAILTLDAPADLRIVGRPATRLRLKGPLAAGEAASLAHALQQVRA